jgi:putative resolvase
MLRIGQLAEKLGVCTKTLRRWEKSGHLNSHFRTIGHHRRYDESVLDVFFPKAQQDTRSTVVYARVSSQDQKEDLKRQQSSLEQWALSQQIKVDEFIGDIGSGLNFKKKGFNKLLGMILNRKVGKIIVNHRDRLMRFGFALIEKLCLFYRIEILVVKAEELSFEVQLSQDLIEIITVFSAKLYGKRSHQNKKDVELAENVAMA